ncbi:hypothetical protein Aeqsu_3080 [Aequorivita sublithincola DSM 14238]|uniref:Uncharacterized protein n=1 Tax=Aequorivita sublithincola (strain DSM 14238 / LMG 21431 / ACAM 643 / 9-3) TaxID=746697 RepID=I3YZU9_AEQSU|nr:hypothetical protein Aeqsu_3080 [Aequorivita sublithincola DSM 14238]
MKTFYVAVLLLICSMLATSCTPTNLAEQVQKDQRNVLSTGDDHSVRPDNDKD